MGVLEFFDECKEAVSQIEEENRKLEQMQKRIKKR
jgi:hypothetical protein